MQRVKSMHNGKRPLYLGLTVMLEKQWLSVLLGIALISTASAQTPFTGTVYEAGTQTRLSNMFVHNLTNGKIELTDALGKFSLQASVNDVIVFSGPGYLSDTIVLLNLRPVKRFMRPTGILLQDVSVTAQTFDIRKEYPEAFTRGEYLKLPITGGVQISLTRLFGKKGRRARKLKRTLQREVIERKIDSLFSEKVVGAFIPLKGADMKDFLFFYRPTLGFLLKASPEDLLLYINNSYKEFRHLPIEKRTINFK